MIIPISSASGKQFNAKGTSKREKVLVIILQQCTINLLLQITIGRGDDYLFAKRLRQWRETERREWSMNGIRLFLQSLVIVLPANICSRLIFHFIALSWSASVAWQNITWYAPLQIWDEIELAGWLAGAEKRREEMGLELAEGVRSVMGGYFRDIG